MFGYFWRGMTAALAVIYTTITIGLSYFLVPASPEYTATAISTESTEKSPKITVHVLQNSEETSFQLQQALDLYSNNLSEKVQISVRTVGGSDYHSVLKSRLLSGENADLFQISGAREYFELEKHIRELGTLNWLSEAYPGTLDAVSYNKKIFGVPYSIEGFGLICNRDIFVAAEISLNDIQTFEDLAKAFADLNGKISSGELPEDFAGLEAVCEFPAQDMSFLSGGFADIALSGTFSSPAEAALSQTASFPAAVSVEALVKLLARYSANGMNWKKLAEISNARQIERFASGRVAMILQNTNVYKLINELNPELKGRTFLLPVPLDTFEQSSIYTGVPKYWAINSAVSDEAAEIVEGFLTWLYCSEEGAEYFASEFGAVSPFRDTAKNTGATLHSQMLGYMEAGMTLPGFHREFPENWGRDIFAPNVQSYFTDADKTWADVVEASKNGWAAERAR